MGHCCTQLPTFFGMCRGGGRGSQGSSPLLLPWAQGMSPNHSRLGSCWVQVFFCKYNDPIYVKMEKLEIMIKLANEKNIDQVCPCAVYCA